MSPFRCLSAASDWCKSTSTVTCFFAPTDPPAPFLRLGPPRRGPSAALPDTFGDSAASKRGSETVRTTGTTSPASEANPSPSVLSSSSSLPPSFRSEPGERDWPASWSLRVYSRKIWAAQGRSVRASVRSVRVGRGSLRRYRAQRTSSSASSTSKEPARRFRLLGAQIIAAQAPV